MHNAYDCYLNLESPKSYAEFEYVFEFFDKELVYQYKKTDANHLISEKVLIDKREVIYYDFEKNEGYTCLRGTETLKNVITSENPISRVKYISSNAILEENLENSIFIAFMDFVQRMLLFFSLDQRGYEGFRVGSEGIGSGILEKGNLREFQDFLAENGIYYHLVQREVDGLKEIYCQFDNKEVDFFKIASTGTRSLALFYYWYIRMREASLVYIDEFDAFYHFELSRNIIERLRKINGVQILTTTHNTDLMSNDLLRPDCYFILNDGHILPISERTEKEIRQAHNLQKMYKAGAFDDRKG